MKRHRLAIALTATAAITAVLFVTRHELAGADHSPPGTVDTHIVHVHDDSALTPTSGYFHPEPLTPTWADHNAADAACRVADPPSQCDMNIEAGDSVEWWTKSPFHTLPHSVRECTDNTFTNCGAAVDPANPISDSTIFSGGAVADTLRYGPITFTAAGTYYYSCEVHPGVMRGRVVVVAAAQQTPSPSPTASPAVSPTAAPTATSGTGTAAATPTRLPASAPQTGGSPADGGSNWAWLLAAVASAIIVASAVTGLTVVRRR